uniref:Uncharacterized protein n=1 Tax=Arundo donax TaxID=35708 RepID=A0A0A9CCF2_ARUDO
MCLLGLCNLHLDTYLPQCMRCCTQISTSATFFDLVGHLQRLYRD